MAPEVLVEKQIDAGQRLIDFLTSHNFPIVAACWIKRQDRDQWKLFLVTPIVNEKSGLREALLKAYQLLEQSVEDRNNWPDFTLEAQDGRFGKALLDLLDQYPIDVPAWAKPSSLGYTVIEDWYLYDLRKEPFTIYGLQFEGDPTRCLHLSFEPHDPNSFFTVGGTTYKARIGNDFRILAPTGAKRERDENGLMKLTWDLHGRKQQSTPNEVHAYAKLGLNGFRLVKNPD